MTWAPRPECPEGRCDGSGWIKAGWERVACPACSLEARLEQRKHPNYKVLAAPKRTFPELEPMEEESPA